MEVRAFFSWRKIYLETSKELTFFFFQKELYITKSLGVFKHVSVSSLKLHGNYLRWGMENNLSPLAQRHPWCQDLFGALWPKP